MARMLKTILSQTLEAEEAASMYSSFDIVGSVVIIKIPEPLATKKNLIGKIILDEIKSVKSVFAQVSSVKGDYRLRCLEHIAGENDTLVEYKEHGCRFKVDLVNTYFSPRLSTERLRVANLVSDNEVVTNMFAGVGTFSIIMARMHSRCKVYSIDINPAAIELSHHNSKLNGVESRVVSILGDAREIISKEIRLQSDRVLMPLPEKAHEYVDCAVEALRDRGGIIHYFAHVKALGKKYALEQNLLDVKSAFSNYDTEIQFSRVVREVGPRVYQVVTDIYVHK
jgi:tRNA (guanine37-N1)-methyltransferase